MSYEDMVAARNQWAAAVNYRAPQPGCSACRFSQFSTIDMVTFLFCNHRTVPGEASGITVWDSGRCDNWESTPEGSA